MDHVNNISANELFKIINLYYEDYRDLKNNDLVKFTNRCKNDISFDNKNKYNIFNMFNNDYYNTSIECIDDNLCLMFIYLNNYTHSFNRICVSLDEDNNELNVKYNDGIDKDFVFNYYDDIINILGKAKYYKDSFSNHIFYKNINLNNNVILRIFSNGDLFYSKNNKNKLIKYNDNSFEELNNINIDLDKLNPFLDKIIKDYKSTNNVYNKK